jgi:hypothetical protein
MHPTFNQPEPQRWTKVQTVRGKRNIQQLLISHAVLSGINPVNLSKG